MTTDFQAAIRFIANHFRLATGECVYCGNWFVSRYGVPYKNARHLRSCPILAIRRELKLKPRQGNER